MTALGTADLLDAFGAGVYLLFGVIHLDLWLRRRDRLGHLWLAAASASALVVDVTGMVLGHVAADSWGALAALNMLGVAGATVFLFEFGSSLGKLPAGPRARLLQGAALVLSPVAAVLLPWLFPPLIVVCGVLLVWAMVRSFRAARRGDRESGVVARGFAVLTACLVVDLLRELKVTHLPGGLPIVGFTVLFLASARSLNDRFEREEVASRTDTLTGLPNRRGFLEASDSALIRSRRSCNPLSVVVADLDGLKRLNDTFGHPTGDVALRAVAAAIRAKVRGQDLTARWGGDEFILLLPDTPSAGALHLAESLRVAVSALPIMLDGGQIPVTISLGVAEHRPERTLEDTIADADAALYEAKLEGRNRAMAR